jgi:hypothetical protein
MKFSGSSLTRLCFALPWVGLLACSSANDSGKLTSGSADAGSRPTSPDAAAWAPSMDAPRIVLAADARAAVDADLASGACTPLVSPLQPSPPEALLVVDRSTGMAEPLSNGGSKWLASSAGVVAATKSTTVAWGMMLFPKLGADGACCQMPTNDLLPEVEVAPSPAASPTMDTVLAGADAVGVGRPVSRAIVQAGNYLSLRASGTTKYIVLLASGEPTCPTDGVCSIGATTTDDEGAKDAVTHVASLLTIPVGVVAVGLASSTNSLQPGPAQQFFTDLAKLGGLPNTSAGQPAYYAAATAGEIAAALSALAAQMDSCTFAVPALATSRPVSEVTIAGARVARDTSHQNGWDFADYGTSVVLFGKACAAARAASGAVEVQLTTSCPSPVI